MKTKLTLLLGLLACVHCLPAFAQGTAFTYQGRLNSTGAPASGNYDLTFTLFDSPGGGASVGGFVQLTAVPVSNGLFTVTINTNGEFGATAFNGAARWLEIGVRTNCNCLLNFTTLTPRQPLTPAPYAIFAENVGAGGLSAGTNGNAVTFNNAANSFTGNGGGLTGVNAATLGGLASSNFWKLGGNAGANPANGNFIGTTDNQPLEFRVNNARIMRLTYASYLNTVMPNIVAGYEGNTVSNGVIGATIVGGGATNFFHQVFGNFGTVIGGLGNTSGGEESVAMGYGSKASGPFSLATGFRTVASGAASTAMGNQSLASGDESMALGLRAIADGFASTALGQSSASNSYATAMGYKSVASGYASTAAGFTSIASGDHATSMGDSDANGFGSTALGNSIAANTNSTSLGNSIAAGNYSTATGQSAAVGDSSTAMGRSTALAIGSTAGGVSKASGNYSVALGSATASGNSATAIGPASIADGDFSVAMGYLCTTTNSGSFALGTAAHAKNFGSFVWSDAWDGGFVSFDSTADNQFLIQARGGVGIGLNNPAAALHVASAGNTPQFQIAQNTSSDYTRLRMNVGANQFWEMDVSPGATPRLEFWNSTRRMYVDYNGNVSATSFNPTSDRNAKENFEPINAREVLDKVAALPLTEWNFKEDSATKHIGPMAQDFYAAFGVGPDNKHIATVDADGVALAAIQGLNEKVEIRSQKSEDRSRKLEEKLEQKETEITELKQRLEALEKIICNQKFN